MKKIYNILIINILILSSWACDEIKEVPEPKIFIAETPLNSTTVLYTQSNNFVAFDTKILLAKV